MKNKMTRNVILMAVVTVIMAVALSLYIQNTGTVPAADNAASLTDGTYTSSAQGCLSDVTVKVGTAAEALAAALLKTGSTAGVDAVSGSTMTSQAIFTAMDDCLSQAQ